jgi:hypothetical protein
VDSVFGNSGANDAAPPFGRVVDDQLLTSPFLRIPGECASSPAIETITGRSYTLTAAERALLDRCRTAHRRCDLSEHERSLAASLADRWLLLDSTALARLGRLTVHALDVEAAGACNAECVFCPREALERGRGVGIMSERTFDVVLDRFGEWLRFVGFVGVGEPTLNRSLPHFVRRLTARRVTSMLVTNGSLLTPALIDALLDAGLSRVQVSFNGHAETSKPSYEREMRRLDFDRTRSNIESLIERAAGRVPVHVSAVETRDNAAALAGFVRFWRDRGAAARLVPCHSRGHHVDLAPHRDSLGALVSDGPERCGLFATRSFISWDGRVLACCHDIRGETALGDVAADSAETIIARKLQVMARGAWFPLCRTCDEPARQFEPAPAAIASLDPAGLLSLQTDAPPRG